MNDQRDERNDPPPSQGTKEPWKNPGQASQDPSAKQLKPDLDKWNNALKKQHN